VPARQAQVEAVLEARARELGADIRRGHELVGLSQNQDAVTVKARGPQGTYRLRARYLVGCDGAHSLVRKQAGIGFPGTAATQLHWLGEVTLAEADLARLPQRIERTATGLFTVVPLGGGVHRIVVSEWTRPPGHPDRDISPAIEELRAAVRRVAGIDLAMRQPRWLSRLPGAARYRAGRVLVAGDAAHTQLPAGAAGPDRRRPAAGRRGRLDQPGPDHGRPQRPAGRGDAGAPRRVRGLGRRSGGPQHKQTPPRVAEMVRRGGLGRPQARTGPCATPS